jgi:hypothetical protein
MGKPQLRDPRRHWTAAIYTRSNPAMIRLLRSRWHRPVSRRAALLGITGRRTGHRYEICVGYSQHSNDVIDILVSDASNRTWWRNFVDGGQVAVVLRGEERVGWATAYRAPSAEFATVANRALMGIVGRRGARRFFEIADFDPAIGLRRAELERLAGFAVAVQIELAETDRSDDPMSDEGIAHDAVVSKPAPNEPMLRVSNGEHRLRRESGR